ELRGLRIKAHDRVRCRIRLAVCQAPFRRLIHPGLEGHPPVVSTLTQRNGRTATPTPGAKIQSRRATPLANLYVNFGPPPPIRCGNFQGMIIPYSAVGINTWIQKGGMPLKSAG